VLFKRGNLTAIVLVHKRHIVNINCAVAVDVRREQRVADDASMPFTDMPSSGAASAGATGSSVSAIAAVNRAPINLVHIDFFIFFSPSIQMLAAARRRTSSAVRPRIPSLVKNL
jgi:hypothetical protein